ncbi:YlxR family protein [Corynebacterium phocae]|uniref:YlxR family protein n=1 Tax=Corynebacterium phocae TaxID=161895 RepID=UPI0009518D60|nr:YlxR family protein [Corynebacterium phocae]KAA8724930.1 YlxR family protein [Corynebacterium phocae]
MSSTRLRTCIATGKRRPDTELLRLVVDTSEQKQCRVLADPLRRLPGRGAWITPEESALELAERRRAFARAFRTSAPVDTGQVHQYLQDHHGLASSSTRQDEKRKTEH